MRHDRSIGTGSSNVTDGDDPSTIGMRLVGPITGPQRAMLALLDDGSEADSVGLEAEMLNAHQIAVCERLVGKDLVRFDIGWRYSCWFRLTPAGREVLRDLATEKPTSRPTPIRRRAKGEMRLRRTCGTKRPNPTRTGTHGQT